MNEQFLRQFLATVKCSVCGCLYDEENVHVLGHEQDLWFMSVFCSQCQSRSLVAAVVREKKRKATGDVAFEPVPYVDGQVVSVDDVLDMHNFLKDFEGDFRKLFASMEKL